MADTLSPDLTDLHRTTLCMLEDCLCELIRHNRGAWYRTPEWRLQEIRRLIDEYRRSVHIPTYLEYQI